MRALITGITGQDGSHLADLLLSKGYEVHGLVRRSSTTNLQRIEHIINDVNLHEGDLTDFSSVYEVVKYVKPDELYNLAAQSHVGTSFKVPEFTVDVTGMGFLRLLEAVRANKLSNKTKIYQAGSSEMFGDVLETPQNEKTPFNPNSPYACAKVFAFNLGVNYRRAYNMFICNGILFNHEGERRGHNFVTRKITKAAADIKRGLKKELRLGNIDTKRDWGYAKEYVECMYLMLQQDKPDDYIVATGETHTVEEFLDASFKAVELDWHDYVVFDEKFMRPSEVNLLLGDARKARDILGWEPKVKFEELVKIMVKEDLGK